MNNEFPDYCSNPGDDFTWQHIYVERHGSVPIYHDVSSIHSQIMDHVIVGFESVPYHKCLNCGKIIYD